MEQGYSWNTFDEVVAQALQVINPSRILDIGAGQGKYGRLVKNLALQHTKMTAIECDAELNDHLTNNGYHEILNITAQELYKHSNDNFEVIILGDVLEHMKHSEGQDLLEFLVYRSEYIIIVTPECMPMNHPVFFVGHNSHWPARAMQWHDWWAHEREGQMHLYILRGLVNWGAVPLQEVVRHVNASQIGLQVAHAADTTRTRPAELKIVDNRLGHLHPDDSNIYMTYRPN